MTNGPIENCTSSTVSQFLHVSDTPGSLCPEADLCPGDFGASVGYRSEPTTFIVKKVITGAKEHPYEQKMLAASFVIKKDATKGIVETIVSVTDVTDYHDDIIVEGAFKKTISERGRKVKVLNHHNSYSVLDSIGVCLEMREVGRDELPELLLLQYPDATGVLLTVIHYLMNILEGWEHSIASKPERLITVSASTLAFSLPSIASVRSAFDSAAKRSFF